MNRSTAAFGAFLLAIGIVWVGVWFGVVFPAMSKQSSCIGSMCPEAALFSWFLLVIGALIAAGGAALLAWGAAEKEKPLTSS